MAPMRAEQTKPTRSANRKNFRFFLLTLGSGLSGLGLAGIMTEIHPLDALHDALRQGFCLE